MDPASSTVAEGVETVVQVDQLRKYFTPTGGVFSNAGAVVKAVDGVSFRIDRARTLGLVGESGCGKTTVGRTTIRLLDATSGRITFMGRDITRLTGEALRQVRRGMHIIFQDPYGSLNPRMTVGDIIGEGLAAYRVARGRRRREEVKRLLRMVGLDAAHARLYPHEFSGGQRQRVGIARAIALRPRLIVCDEPVSALDVSVQAQIINLLVDLQNRFGIAYLFISHDLAVVKHVSNEIAVMYMGRLVESAETHELFDNPIHPYTQALLLAVPVPDPRGARKRIALVGDVASALNPPGGCPFHPRCPKAGPDCEHEVPQLDEVTPGHHVACLKA